MEAKQADGLFEDTHRRLRGGSCAAPDSNEKARQDSAALLIAAPGVALLIAAPCLLTLCLSTTGPQSRGRAAVLAADCGSLNFVDSTANDVTASPLVTSPSATVARFGVLDLPLVASLVQVRCMAVVAIARIGGLYGP